MNAQRKTRPDQKPIDTAWKKRGFSCELWSDPPGQVWADFIHSRDELLMLIEGDLELEMGGQKLKPLRGQEILIPAGTKHTVRNVGSTRSRWYYGYQL